MAEHAPLALEHLFDFRGRVFLGYPDYSGHREPPPFAFMANVCLGLDIQRRQAWLGDRLVVDAAGQPADTEGADHRAIFHDNHALWKGCELRAAV